MTAPSGVLLMAYGSPATLEDVEAYYTHIRGGRTPSQEAVDELCSRYRQIGGRSPLPEVTRRQAAGVEALLREQGVSMRVYVGMKHAHPFIDETVTQMATDGIRQAAGVALAPHYSKMSIGGYISAAASASAAAGIDMRCVEHYHDHPGLVRSLADRIEIARSQFPKHHDVPIVFTAHSLPERILAWGDPYPDQLQRTCELVASAASIDRWRFAFQSASHTSERWLGPDVLEVLRELRQAGAREIIVSPLGFVADHLEVLYDIDVEARQTAQGLGMRLERAPSLNDGLDFLSVLADVAGEALTSFQVRERV
ncbi:MAG: ferrochelatase [bacterium]